MTVETGLEGLDPPEIAQMADCGKRNVARAPDEFRALAMNRALALPDNAGEASRRNMMADHSTHLDRQTLLAMFELQFRRIVGQQAEDPERVPDDEFSSWLREQRDGERRYSRDWWTIHWLRVRYLGSRATDPDSYEASRAGVA